MMPAGDPHQFMRRQVWASAGVAAGLIGIAGSWAMLRSDLPPLPKVYSGDETPFAERGTTALKPAIWNVTLWQPLSDAPVAPTVTAPLTIKLFSILAQDGGLTAAIDPGNGDALVYAHPGDTIRGATITAVDATGVSVSYAGSTQRLELAP